MTWWIFALFGAIFAGATNVLIKAGMKGVNSYSATAVRALLILPVVWILAVWLGKVGEISKWTSRNWVFLTLSAIAAGLSWVCSYKAIDMAGAAAPAPIDKSSLAFTVVLAVIFLHERLTWQTSVATLLVLAALAVTLIPSPSSTASAGFPVITPPLTSTNTSGSSTSAPAANTSQPEPNDSLPK